MTPELESLIKQWLEWDRNDATRNEILELKEKNEVQKLQELLMNRMEFGTAGLRAKMGPGYSQMNDLTIIQTSQGLLEYAKQQFPNLEQLGIIVGYDMRHNSKKWAVYLSNIFIKAGYFVYLFRDHYPTPLLAFGVKYFKTSLGVMITASHNPKEDNGYKVYWSNGCQIIPPHDKGISTCIEKNLVPKDLSWDIDSVLDNPLCRNPVPELIEAYIRIQKETISYTYDTNRTSKLSFTYTAMHGVGWESVKMLTAAFGFATLVPVIQQVTPDPDIPTVKYPNPEEGRSALNLAIERANAVGSPVILANDPDADRLAVAERQSNGSWKIFTGNELGALFGNWIWTMWRKFHPNSDVSKVGMLSSTVSSKFLQTMAEAEGFYFEETLTGFKWMGNRSFDLSKQGIEVIFAFEEAIGFMCGPVVLDKDGISALAVMCELASEAYGRGSNLQQTLDQIYAKYGQHISNNGYYFCHEPQKIVQMFDRIRHWPQNPGPNGYPQELGRFKIVGIRDLTTDYDTAYPDFKARLPISRSSQFVTFLFDNGVTLTIRTSGTEPKIKYYSELRSNPNSRRSVDDLTAELQELIDLVVDQFYEPEKNGFKPRPQ